MNFEDIVKRECNTDELSEKVKELDSQCAILFKEVFLESKIKCLKENMKKTLIDEFIEFFNKLEFKTDISHKGDTDTITAKVGNYSVDLYVTSFYAITISVQSKKSYARSDYRLFMDISKNTSFKSLTSKASYIGVDNVAKSLSLNISRLEEDIKLLSKMKKENHTLEVVCKFSDGQKLDMWKEYKTFQDIIKDIPEE
ncbi:hypothetical protein [Clostridium estertheticum]|uniref:Uncharacterized protein n=1 Tax=Clostridium estertheticum TaxID=238834 RepID=A0AA47I970_9CLOT|nr:hypothetical protein [Clostridium estertheticum]MBU3157842.1 hypothetical protein [Clostridium estertheticum]WAG62590.1 hypothetical protein LL038_10270 [Clostridium estertheticum]